MRTARSAWRATPSRRVCSAEARRAVVRAAELAVERAARPVSRAERAVERADFVVLRADARVREALPWAVFRRRVAAAFLADAWRCVRVWGAIYECLHRLVAAEFYPLRTKANLCSPLVTRDFWAGAARSRRARRAAHRPSPRTGRRRR